MTPADEATAADRQVLDYGRSFICNDAPFNNVRFWVESRCTILDERAGSSQTFYQCGSCKSENTFAKQDLFHADNYDFLPILGGSTWLIFRRPCRVSDTYRQLADEVWGRPALKLRYAQGVTKLADFAAIRDATAAALPIVAQTEIWNETESLRAVIEYPVKTMNISIELGRFQTDTGPVAWPDLSRRYQPPLDALRLAFVAFNSPDFADFVIEQPTPVVEDGVELAEVYHYSNPISLPAQNRLYACQ